MAKDDCAVVVGVNRYPALPSLMGPENDANDFESWLLKEGQVDKCNIYKFTTKDFPPPPPPPAEPTEIRVAMESFKVLGDRVIKQGRIGRRLYIYLAGHGLTFYAAPDYGQYNVAVLMANATKKETVHHIPGRSYLNWFIGAKAFDEVVLFMDCCREDQTLSPELPFPLPPAPSPRKCNVKVLNAFAVLPGNAAREEQIGPGGQERGLFTMGLLAALRQRGKIMSGKLGDQVYQYMDKYTRSEERQEPDFYFSDNFLIVENK